MHNVHNIIDFGYLPPIVFDSARIPYLDTGRNLGVIFDRYLTLKPHVAEVNRKVFYAPNTYFSLSQFVSILMFKNLLPTITKITMDQSILYPVLDYTNVWYPDLTIALINKLERIQNMGARFIILPCFLVPQLTT